MAINVTGIIGSAVSGAAKIGEVTQRAVSDSVKAAKEDPAKKIEKAGKEATGEPGIRFPSDLQKYALSLSFYKYRRPTVSSRLSLSKQNDIVLPIPSNLIDTTSVSYTDAALPGLLGYITEGSLNGASAVMNSFLNASRSDSNLQSGAESALNLLKDVTAQDMSNTINNLGGAAASQLLQGPAGKSILQSFGSAENQYLTVMLNGPTFKTHQFQWKLSPRTEKESNDLQKIINTLKKAALPSLGAVKTLYDYPSIVRLDFLPSEDYTWYSFKPCVVKNISVNWSPDGVPAFYAKSNPSSRGAPVTVTLAIEFQEIELWFGDQIVDDAILPGFSSRLNREGSGGVRFDIPVTPGPNQSTPVRTPSESTATPRPAQPSANTSPSPQNYPITGTTS